MNPSRIDAKQGHAAGRFRMSFGAQVPALLSLLLLAPACGEPLDHLDQAQRMPASMPSEELVPATATEPGQAPSTCQGYHLMQLPMDERVPGGHTMLVDMQGREVKRFKLIGEPAILLPGGSIIGSSVPHLHAGTTEMREVRQLGWTGAVEWQFSSWDEAGMDKPMARQHHDMQREGNPVGYYAPFQEAQPRGKTLVLAHRDVVRPEISKRPLIDDVIYEVDITGRLTGFVWNASDHVDEMGFDTEARAGLRDAPCSEHACGPLDWLHLNSIAELGRNRFYDETGDERFHPRNIMISSREAAFIAIISRRTGAIVWRVGPDFSPGQPEHAIGQIMGQHHAHMIPEGLPGAGNILLFDNGTDSGYGGPDGRLRYRRSYSRVIEFNPVTLAMVWQYGEKSGPQHFRSQFLSSAQRLPNGNTLVTASLENRAFEVTSDGRVVWQMDFASVGPGLVQVYRVTRVPPEWLPAGANTAGYAAWRDGGC